jgi:glycerol-3-phosphate dehydrogenase
MPMADEFDLLIIGAGVNGAGIARDAAGRGLRVCLADSGDIGGGTSAASTKLIHGGLRYLEFYEFGLVRKALQERERLMAIAEQIIWPMGFVIPHPRGGRPAWLVRLGLWLYDHLARRERLQGSRRLRLDRDPAGAILNSNFQTGFRYWDCWVEDSRLTVLNAMDAARRGADIRPRTAVTRAEPQQNGWRVDFAHGPSVSAPIMINAAGPWAEQVDRDILKVETPVRLRLVKGSHIVVPRVNPTDDAYLLQQPDGRIVFLIPYEKNYSLIGTTEERFTGDPRDAAISEAETDYLLSAVNAFLNRKVEKSEIIWTYAGVRPLVEDASASDRKVTRDWRLVDHNHKGAKALTVVGGKITTYRVLAEAVLSHLGFHHPSWTAQAALPSIQMPLDLSDESLTRFANEEWAQTAEDVLWRRTKFGLHCTMEQKRHVEAWFASRKGS